MEYQLTDIHTGEAINILITQTFIPSEYEMNKAVDNIKDIIFSHLNVIIQYSQYIVIFFIHNYFFCYLDRHQSSKQTRHYDCRNGLPCHSRLKNQICFLKEMQTLFFQSF